ncbi:MAG: hypothetical protein H7Y38_12170 [Armatimonadetes bacterium]|nr:hypothetical protein [Armatimonadota bacterium]
MSHSSRGESRQTGRPANFINPRIAGKIVPILVIVSSVVFGGGCSGTAFSNNRPPEIRSFVINGQMPTEPDADAPDSALPYREVARGATATLTISVRDPDNDPLVVTWEGATRLGGDDTEGSKVATLTVEDTTPNVVTVVVRDDRGGVATRTISVVGVDTEVNRPPTVTLKTQTEVSELAPGASVTVVAEATDPDNDTEITYQFIPSGGATVVVPDADKPNEAVLTAPTTGGVTVSVVCIATDSKEGTGVATLSLPVRAGVAPSPSPSASPVP